MLGQRTAVLALLVLGFALPALAQIDIWRDDPCCQFGASPRTVWVGDDPEMTFETLAAHCAPILWFSPDEPLLEGVDRPDGINIPMAFPFEEQSPRPVVYYRIRTIIQGGDEVAVAAGAGRSNDTVINLDRVSAIDIDYFFYYPSEEGLGGHVHDVESLEVKLAIFRQPVCEHCRYGISVRLVNGKAHGVLWFDNTLETDEYTRFPITVLVEEGKHASCTDKNGDGYYTPSFDVNKRVNDAWGVRDVLRGGGLFSGQYQGWFAKVRNEEDRIFPPLPLDNRHRERFVVDGVYAPDNVQYDLRPWPDLEPAVAFDPALHRFVDKGHPDWPDVEDDATMERLVDWVDSEYFAKSLSISVRYDGDVGVSFVFPMFVVKNFYVESTGGWLVNRIYLKDKNLRDFGWNVIYTSSASRWFDGYFSAGLEVDEYDVLDGTDTRTGFVSETGIKLRGNISHSPLKFLSFLSDFLGLRAGIRYRGFESFDEIGYVLEFGAGSF